MMGNLDSVMFDKAIFGDDADSFNPERFLDEEGKLQHFEAFIPFSIGKRACMGENLAKMELFLFIASMCQRFSFESPDPENPPKIVEKVNNTRKPAAFEVRCVERRL